MRPWTCDDVITLGVLVAIIALGVIRDMLKERDKDE